MSTGTCYYDMVRRSYLQVRGIRTCPLGFISNRYVPSSCPDLRMSISFCSTAIGDSSSLGSQSQLDHLRAD